VRYTEGRHRAPFFTSIINGQLWALKAKPVRCGWLVYEVSTDSQIGHGLDPRTVAAEIAAHPTRAAYFAQQMVTLGGRPHLPPLP